MSIVLIPLEWNQIRLELDTKHKKRKWRISNRKKVGINEGNRGF